jgi:hypothetical protein
MAKTLMIHWRILDNDSCFPGNEMKVISHDTKIIEGKTNFFFAKITVARNYSFILYILMIISLLFVRAVISYWISASKIEV